MDRADFLKLLVARSLAIDTAVYFEDNISDPVIKIIIHGGCPVCIDYQCAWCGIVGQGRPPASYASVGPFLCHIYM